MAYYAELQKIPGFQVLPVGVVEQVLVDLQLELNNPDDVQHLARELEVDVVIRGRVIALEDRSGTNGRLPYCALQIDLLVAESGELLASTYRRRSGDAYQKILHYGTIHTKSGLIAQVSREIINVWEEKGLSHCPEK